ncbi:Fibrinogen silencer-binding protein-like 1 [Homarus americanus]|uniref:Regulatory protein zeste n=1 Tax=Homarus americanus TaxID=6706 RepID=A0A8J5NBT2_HOMAM|nr:Fibrinogen silencer-binding protein-like 1 [Homarus americanus]
MEGRERSAALSETQRLALLCLIEQRPVIEDRSTSNTINEEKRKAWDEITASFNASNPDQLPRTAKQLKRSYEHIKGKQVYVIAPASPVIVPASPVKAPASPVNVPASPLENTCLVKELLEKPFSRRNISEKIEILGKRRPCVSSDRSSAGLLEHVKHLLSHFNCGGKLVAQTYDGAAVMAGQQNGLNKKTLSCLAAFFSKSSKRTFALQAFLEKQLPRVAPTRWNFSSKLVNTVKEYYDQLTSFFHHILDQSAEWDDDCVLKGQGFLSFLQKFQTRFLLNVFSSVFSFTDVVFKILKKKGMDIAYCSKKVEELIGKIKKIREDDFDRIFQESVPGRNDENPIKRPRRSEQLEEAGCRALFNEILDNILVQLRDRFQTVTQLEFFSLLNSNFFEKHCKQFPDSAVKCLEKQYGSFFDTVRLKNELSVLYVTPEFKEELEIRPLVPPVNRDILSLARQAGFQELEFEDIEDVLASHTEELTNGDLQQLTEHSPVEDEDEEEP